MFVIMSLHDRLVCFAGFSGMILLTVLFLLPLFNSFFRVCLPKLFAVVLKKCLPLTASGAANSKKSAPTCLQLRRYIYVKLELPISQYFVKVHRIHFHVVVQNLYIVEPLLVLEQPSCNVF